MESLAYTYSALAWEEETPELRKVNWVGVTSTLAIVASVNSGVAYSNEIHVPQSFDTPDSSELVSEFSDDSEFDYSGSDYSRAINDNMVSPEIFTAEVFNSEVIQTNFTESAAIASEIAPPETIFQQYSPETNSADFSPQKQTKSNLAQNQKNINAENIEIANKSYGYYPRPYYSRTKIPENLKISPFNLVYRAYNGGFQDSGIPGFKSLMTSTKSGKIDATDLIRAGIIQGRLTTQDLYDPGYVNAVRAYLKDLRG
ncbi:MULTISPECIES: hypothetical protein [Spirulina sp. CCY15215]|uniref:hypothetical protein n=1 Tax=Spirulina sp. CCY15215 TaxID=2767591 RepID=UPI00194E547E|nr:hypothetical protein [Spirulina major]